MSVVTRDASTYSGARKRHRCTLCNSKLRYPFLHWEDGYKGDGGSLTLTSMSLCARCCAKIKHGFMADLIQCAAIAELATLSPAFRGYTLERTTPKELVAQFEQGEREGARIIKALDTRRDEKPAA